MNYKRAVSVLVLIVFILQPLYPLSVAGGNVRRIEVPLQGAEVLEMDSEITRVVLGNPELAELNVVTTREILIVGKQRGSTTLHVWTDAGLREFRINITDRPDRERIDKEGLLRELGVVDEDGHELRVFSPRYRDLGDIEEYFEELLGDEGEILLSDQAAEQIYVLGPAKLLDQIEELLERLDVPDEEMEFTRRIDLDNRSVTELIDKVERLLSEEGIAVMDEETNSILVIDSVSRGREIEDYLEGIDVATVAQVRIEAKFVEMSEEASREIGIDWQYDGTVDGSAAFVDFSPDIKDLDGLSLGIADDFTALMQFLESEDLANLISSPNIMTRNQQQATLEVINEKNYMAGCRVERDNGQTFYIPDVESVEEGITLEATPLMGGEDIIQLSVKPELKIVSFDPALAEDSPCGMLQFPAVDRRQSELEVALQDGQTLVIGGLSRQATADESREVPLLGKIPIVGPYLFGYQRDERESREINIFLTAEIVRLDEEPSEEVMDPAAATDTVPEEMNLFDE